MPRPRSLRSRPATAQEPCARTETPGTTGRPAPPPLPRDPPGTIPDRQLPAGQLPDAQLTDAQLTDGQLTDTGLDPPSTCRKPALVLACGALAREIGALVRINGWSTLDLACLPAILHNHPDRIPAAVEAAVLRHRPHYARIFVAYADCGTGGTLARTCARLGVEMIEGPHCYAFFDGLSAFQARAEDEMTSFYLTDFLARQFDAFVWRPLGLDRHPELLPQYFGHYERLIYLAQTDDPGLDAAARRAAERLGLAYERRATGYGDLATALARAAITDGPPREPPGGDPDGAQKAR